nr:membrane protein insertase YidC [uncultured Desulfuromonas sp.]
MENKNTLIALVLMLVVWTGFTYLFPPAEKNNVENIVENPVELTNNAVISEDVSVSPLIANNIEDRHIVVENNFYKIIFSESTASIIDFKLKKYKETALDDSDYVSLLNLEQNIQSLCISGNKGLTDISKYNYTSSSIDNVIINDSNFSLNFTSKSDDLSIIKSFVFSKDKYDFDLFVKIKNLSNNDILGNVTLALSNFWSEETKGNRLEFIGPVYYSEDKVTTVDVEDINSDVYENISWIGYENKYFISALIGGNEFSNLVFKHQENTIQSNYITSVLNIIPGSETTISSRVFFGPKDVQILKDVDSNLAKVIDFGFFKIIAKPLHLILNFFYGFIGNYGFSIILLTVIIKLLFWPLTQKSYVSMKAMQKLQPEMKKLREKYSNDRESLNKKMMELYKEHRVNPLGGCLPMLVQIPVFFALYKVLLDTIELRHAPFIFWITDLSVKDPYYITPLIMGVTMFIQQKLTPSTMDPMQAKMMLAMPVVFTFLFLNFPAGLVVYWLVNNLLTIFQQYLIFKKPA